jgi:hypothetical protein
MAPRRAREVQKLVGESLTTISEGVNNSLLKHTEDSRNFNTIGENHDSNAFNN